MLFIIKWSFKFVFKFFAFSIKHSSKDHMNCAFNAPPQSIGANDGDVSVIFSYSIVWEVKYEFLFMFLYYTSTDKHFAWKIDFVDI